MDAAHLPTIIGQCPHCHQPLYTTGPVQHLPGGQVAHIACHVDQHRHG